MRLVQISLITAGLIFSTHGIFSANPYVYPPRISFRYQLSDSQGKSLNQGEEKLTGQRSSAPRGHSANDVSFYYEKALLTDWFNNALINK